MAEYISRFDQYTGQTGWSDANHRTRFYDGLSEQLKDNLAISDRPITSLQELKAAAQVPDQCMRQHEAEKKGHTYHTTSQAPSKDPNAMEVDASCVTTPPMVGSTWPRVRSTLESDCLPTLFQGTVSFCLAMD